MASRSSSGRRRGLRHRSGTGVVQRRMDARRRPAAVHRRPVRTRVRPARSPRCSGRAAVHQDRLSGRGQPGWRPSGSSAASRVPPPAVLSTPLSVPPSASTRSISPRSPDPFDGSAPPAPSSATSTRSRPALTRRLRGARSSRRRAWRRWRAPRRRRSRRPRRSPPVSDVRRRRPARRAPGSARRGTRARGSQAACPAPRGWRPRAIWRRSVSVCTRCTSARRTCSPAPSTSGTAPQPPVSRRHGPLDTVMEADLEPAAFLVGSDHEAPPRGRELVDLRPHLGRQGGVGGRQPRRRGHRVDERRLLEHRAGRGPGRRTAATRVRRTSPRAHHRRQARATDRPFTSRYVAGRRPVADLQRRVAERVRRARREAVPDAGLPSSTTRSATTAVLGEARRTASMHGDHTQRDLVARAASARPRRRTARRSYTTTYPTTSHREHHRCPERGPPIRRARPVAVPNRVRGDGDERRRQDDRRPRRCARSERRARRRSRRRWPPARSSSVPASRRRRPATWTSGPRWTYCSPLSKLPRNQPNPVAASEPAGAGRRGTVDDGGADERQADDQVRHPMPRVVPVERRPLGERCRRPARPGRGPARRGAG